MPFYDDHAHLYDIAFSWDVAEEVSWLLERLGPDMRTILEPACGSGRMFPEFCKRGVEVVGVELSETMIRRACDRLVTARLPEPRILHGDMTDFSFDERFDGAVCPINSFGYLLTPEAARAHLACVARHLRPGGKYMLQLDPVSHAKAMNASLPANSWEAEHLGTRVKTSWHGRSFDPESKLETQMCRFEVLSGPSKGILTETEHIQRRWDWSDWTALIEDSPFELSACYDGNTDECPHLHMDSSLENRHLLWHELALV